MMAGGDIPVCALISISAGWSLYLAESHHLNALGLAHRLVLQPRPNSGLCPLAP